MILTSREWFDEWFDTPYYHQLYFQRDEKEAAAFIHKLILHLQPAPGSRLLDVACGKGRHSLLLAAEGYEVTGIDISTNSIESALQNAAGKATFYVHDMRQPFWINYFDFAFNFFTSFGYFRTLREHNAALRTIAQALKPGGTLIMDYLNVPYAEAHLVPTQQIQKGKIDFHLNRWMDAGHFFKKIEVHDTAAGVKRVFMEKVAKFSAAQFEQMLATQDMEVVAIFGNYNLDAYHPMESPRMIIQARKKA